MEPARTTHGIRRDARPNRVFVIDDDPDIRDMLQSVLEANGYRTDTFDSAIQFLSSGAATLAGCVITDVQMPGMSGLELQRELQRRGAHTAIVVMAGNGIVHIAVRAMKAGAIDFLEKPFSEAALLDSVGRALESISKTETSLSFIEVARTRIALLSKRERQVLDRVVGGDSNKVVALELRISPRTVETHRASAIKKMGAKSLAELVRMSIAGTGPRPQA